MKITIHYSTKIGTIKQAFNRMFPYLRIEFVTRPCSVLEARKGINGILHNMFVGEINSQLKEGSINISGDGKTAAVTHLFRQDFGLPVQIFRKERKIWVATDTSEELTLSQQNEMGKKASSGTLMYI